MSAIGQAQDQRAYHTIPLPLFSSGKCFFLFVRCIVFLFFHSLVPRLHFSAGKALEICKRLFLAAKAILVLLLY